MVILFSYFFLLFLRWSSSLLVLFLKLNVHYWVNSPLISLILVAMESGCRCKEHHSDILQSTILVCQQSKHLILYQLKKILVNDSKIREAYNTNSFLLGLCGYSVPYRFSSFMISIVVLFLQLSIYL